MQVVRSVVPRVVPRFLPRILVLALAVAGCGREVHLGAIGDGGASLLWMATFEPGDLSEWTGDGNGGTYMENATIAPAPTTDVARRGRYAGIATVTPVGGMPSIDYLYRVQPSPREAYYGAWFYIPSTITVKSYISLSHFRVSTTGDGNNLMGMWDVNIIPHPDGSLVAHLYNYTTQTNTEEPIPTPVALDTWVHFEVFFRKAATATGRVAVWQDGVLVIDNPNVVTAATDWVQWDAGGASDNIMPSPAVVYVDDATISLTSVGQGP
jgi:hypothetical protein